MDAEPERIPCEGSGRRQIDQSRCADCGRRHVFDPSTRANRPHDRPDIGAIARNYERLARMAVDG